MTDMGQVRYEAGGVSKSYQGVDALRDVTFLAEGGRVACLLGDHGAGKSTLIKILSGVERPDRGGLSFDGERVRLRSPKDALDLGIATVHQDLGVVPIMPVWRNFFLGREPQRGRGRDLDAKLARKVTQEQLLRMGIALEDVNRPIVTLSGGQRQAVAIARAAYFGAKVLILDEPTSALGVRQAGIVLRCIEEARDQGLAVVFVTHNIHHAFPVGDTFTFLDHGRCVAMVEKSETSWQDVLALMGGGERLNQLKAEFSVTEPEAVDREDAETTNAEVGRQG